MKRVFQAITWFLLTSLLVSGCVQYNTGINFADSNRGEIIQHIKLGERLFSLSGNQAQEWLDSVQRRARQLEGKTIQLSNQEIVVTIPFNNGADLEAKFNQLFQSAPTESVADTNQIPSINSKFSLTQNNFLLLLRNQLSYDLDLRSLSLVSTKGNVPISSNETLSLEFSINTPWGARSVDSENALHPDNQSKQHLVWHLKPGELNHLEAIFWLPSPIGIGAVVIALFIGTGIYLRYTFMPDPQAKLTQPTIT